MADIVNWSPTDESNTSPPPDGWPEFMVPSAVNNCARAMMGAVRRWYNTVTGQIGTVAGVITTGGLTVNGSTTLNGTTTFAGSVSGNVSSGGTITGGQLTSTGNINASGNISGNGFYGNYIHSNGTSDASYLHSSGDIRADGNVSVGGQVAASSIATGTLYGDGSGNYWFGSQGSASIGTGNFRASAFIDNDTGNGLYLGGGNPQINGGLIVQPIGGQQDALYCYANLRVFNGRGYQPGGGVWSDSSDGRLKKNIEPYARGLSEIRRLRPVAYQFNGLAETPSNGQIYQGLVAQEVLDVMPEMVDSMPMRLKPDGPEEPVYTLNATAVIYALVNAVTELAEQVDALQSAK